MKKFIGILLVAAMLLTTVGVMASADTLTDIDIAPNTMIEFNIGAGNSYVDTFTPGLGKDGEYTFISFGDTCPTVTVSYTQHKVIGNDEVITTTIDTDEGMLLGTYDFKLGREYKISVSAPSGGAFSMIFFKPDAEKCGFVTQPDKTSYFRDLEVSINGSSATFLNDCLDLTGASFALVDSEGTTVCTLQDNALKKILKPATYSNNTIKLAVNASKTFLGKVYKEYSSISLDVKAYPIKSVVLNHGPLSYVYGTDGTIRGTLKEHWFIPAIKYNEMTATVTLNDDTRIENIEIKNENGKFFFNVEGIGKVYIVNEAKCPESGENVTADTRIGARNYQLEVTIVKADFFSRIGIFFKLLFGVYNK